MIFINVRSPSPFRISVTTDTAPDLTAADYVLTRVDNASTAATVSRAFATGPTTAELVVINEPLLDGVIYNIALPTQPGAPSATVAYRQPLLQNQTPIFPAEDPEAEAFGVDIDWLADSFGPDGDTPEIRGRQCLTNDLAVISLIQKGELFHRPNSGAGVKLNTNAPMTAQQVRLVTGALTREWYKDLRVRQGGVTIRTDVLAATGQLRVYGSVLPVAIDDPTIVKLPGGGT